MRGEISFDTEVLEHGEKHVEGCYRIAGEVWRPFYFTKIWQGLPKDREEKIVTNHVFRSGIVGILVNFAQQRELNKATVMSVLSDVLGVAEWSEVRGPDSLQMK